MGGIEALLEIGCVGGGGYGVVVGCFGWNGLGWCCEGIWGRVLREGVFLACGGLEWFWMGRRKKRRGEGGLERK